MRLIHLLRKPVSEGTVASNVLKHGVGAINIEASRISTQDSLDGGAYAKNPTPRADSYDLWTSERKGDSQAMRRGFADYEQPTGRWPGNLILQHLGGCKTVADWACVEGCPVAVLDSQSGDRSSPWVGNPNRGEKGGMMFGGLVANPADLSKPEYRDTGGASRFFKQVGGEK